MSKIDAWSKWRTTTDELVRPPKLGRVVRIAVPAGELATAVLVLASPRTGLVVAASLLIGFALAVVVFTRGHRGRECNCLGAVVHGRIGVGLAARNAAMAVVAVLTATYAIDLERYSAGEVLALVVVLLILVMVAEYWRLRNRPMTGSASNG